MSGSVLLARLGAADMVPPERRARAISYVLFGALFGAALGPLVFRPLFAGKDLELDTLVVPWFAAAAMAVVGLVIAVFIRPDPRTIALELQSEDDACGDASSAAPLREILRRPGVPSAVLAALASFAVMVGVMNLTGYIIVGHGHEQADVFTVISVHIVGMYALVLVIGEVIDRVGRRPSLISGLAIMAVSAVVLAWAESISAMSLSLFLLGARVEPLVRRRHGRARHARDPGRARTPRRRHDLSAGLLGAGWPSRRRGVHGMGGRGGGGRRRRGCRPRPS